MDIWVRVIKEGFGYWDIHEVGEEFKIPIHHVQKCLEEGFIEICINNVGNNLPHDEMLGDSLLIYPEYVRGVAASKEAKK